MQLCLILGNISNPLIHSLHLDCNREFLINTKGSILPTVCGSSLGSGPEFVWG